MGGADPLVAPLKGISCPGAVPRVLENIGPAGAVLPACHLQNGVDRRLHIPGLIEHLKGLEHQAVHPARRIVRFDPGPGRGELADVQTEYLFHDGAVVKCEAVLPHFLYLVKGLVALLENGLEILPVLRAAGDPHAARQGAVRQLILINPVEGVHDPPGLPAQGFLSSSVFQENQKLVPAEPRQNIAGVKQSFQPGRRLGQNQIPEHMTSAVVDLLEIVQVDKQHGKLVRIPLFLQQPADLFVGRGLVVELGEGIPLRPVHKGLGLAFLRVDIQDHPHRLDRFTRAVVLGGLPNPAPEILAVVICDPQLRLPVGRSVLRVLHQFNELGHILRQDVGDGLDLLAGGKGLVAEKLFPVG